MIKVNLNKAKIIAHDKRRAARSIEFAPLDIKASIPSESAAAESERQKIREKYSVMQAAIDSANSVDELKSLLPKD